MNRYFGYFDSSEQPEPTYDPGLETDCLICRKKLSAPLEVVYFLDQQNTKVYFYRAHRDCYKLLNEELLTEIESTAVTDCLLNFKLIKCGRCGTTWLAGYPNEVNKLECPGCRNWAALLDEVEEF